MNTQAREAHFAQPGVWPTAEQLLVLKAALLRGDAAVSAFRRWLSLIDLDKDFDRGTFRLLPLMYDNLRQHDVRHPLMSRLKGVYRLSWYKNNKLFSDLRPVLEALQGAGIPMMMLKGVPLVQLYYRNTALRPMSDIDVLVPTAMAMPAITVMGKFPYQPHAVPTADFLKYRHAMQYWSSDRGEIDVHWHALCECCQPGADTIFWNHACQMEFNGMSVLAPDATRMLFHTVIHGLRWNPEPPIRWIADSMVILRNQEAIDWQAIVDFARERQLGYRLKLALSFLRLVLDAPIPDTAIAQLDRQHTSLTQRIENTCVLRDTTQLYETPIGHLWVVFCHYCALARDEKLIPFTIGFTHYLRFRWNLRGRSEMAGYIYRGVAKRVAALFQPEGRPSANH